MSDQSPDDDFQPQQELPPLGAVLRAAREARGEPLSEVAMALKLSQRQIDAIENERFSELPGPAFVKGFVRNYGRHLGVDVEPMIAAHLGGAAASSVELRPLGNARGTLPVSGGRPVVRRLLLPVLLIAAVGLALAWYFDGFDPNPEVEPVTLDESGVAPADVETPGLAPYDESGETLQPPEAEPANEPVVPPEALSDTSGPAAPVVTAEIIPVAPPVVEAPAAAEAEVEAVSAPGRLVFRLKGESWIEVRDGRDRRLYSGLSDAGSVRVVQGQRPFAVTIGNAAGVELEHAGRSVDLASHTSSGGVARLTVE